MTEGDGFFAPRGAGENLNTVPPAVLAGPPAVNVAGDQ